MIKKTIKYVDLEGNELVEDFYFHLFSPEVVRIEASTGMDLKSYIQKLTADQDAEKMVAFLEKIILTAYGSRANGGKSFIKTPEATKEFEYSQAYAELFEEIITTPEKAQEFATGITSNKAKANGVEARPEQ